MIGIEKALPFDMNSNALIILITAYICKIQPLYLP